MPAWGWIMPTVDVPINKGTLPDYNPQFGYPQLFNWYVGEGGSIYPTPGLISLANITGIRFTHYTVFNGGRRIVVTGDTIYTVSNSGARDIVASITNSGLAVQISENLQNQIVIVDGRTAWLYDQRANIFRVLNSDDGLQVGNPGSTTSINSYIIIFDISTGIWQASDPNNATVYNVLQIQEMDTQSGSPVAVDTIDNNLFIFGSIGIERWQPTIVTNPFLPPFQKDLNYKQNFGAISTASVFSATDRIYFLSSLYIPMELRTNGVRVLVPREKGDIEPTNSGMARIISQYVDAKTPIGTFYTFRGNFFYALTYLQTGISWVFVNNTSTWFLTDELVVSASNGIESVATNNGLFNLSLIVDYKTRYWQSERMQNYKGQQTYRNLVNGAEAKINQGLSQESLAVIGQPQSDSPQYLHLQFSKDSVSWGNVVRRPIGLTGERQTKTFWPMSMATGPDLTARLTYTGALNLCIEKFTLTLN